MANKKVLVVDDSLTAVLWQKMILKQAQYEVVTATDGEQGVAAALAERPDLILMDVVMPGMSGFEACRKIRATPGSRHVPIIMVTTPAKLAMVGEDRTSGCNEYLAKPLDRVVLLRKVEGYLGA